MVKGFSVVSVIMVILIIAVIIFLIGYGRSTTNISETKAKMQLYVYSMDHALDAAKLYVGTSLDYSTYQACYDILKTIDSSITDDIFKQRLESSIKNKLNLYIESEYSFLTDYRVSMYDYDNVKIETMSPLKIKATGKYMSIEKRDNIIGMYLTMEKDSALDKTLKIDCYGIYNKAVETIINTKATIGEEIKAKVDSWPKGPVDTKPSETDRVNELKSINVGSERDEGNYHIKPVFDEAKVSITHTENLVTGKFEGIEYKVTVKLRVTVQDTRTDQVFPTYDGTKITFAKLSAEFVFDENYST